jgi:hypothetical protein
MELASNAEQLIQKIKIFNEQGQTTDLPITNSEGELLGHAIAIDRWNYSDPELVKKLTEWRNRFNHAFATQFTPTETRTLDWLSKSTLSDWSRLLFKLTLINDQLVGHLGFRNVNDQSFEMDNLVKGERGGGPNFAHYAVLALLNWGFRNLKGYRAFSNVLQDNHKVILLDYGIGFTDHNHPPIESSASSPSADIGNNAEATQVQLKTLSITRDTFYSKFPWLLTLR